MLQRNNNYQICHTISTKEKGVARVIESRLRDWAKARNLATLVTAHDNSGKTVFVRRDVPTEVVNRVVSPYARVNVKYVN